MEKPNIITWTGKDAIPAIGATITVRVNGIGAAVVQNYFSQEGFLGLLVMPVNPPDWYVKQNGAGAACHVFGAEVSALS